MILNLVPFHVPVLSSIASALTPYLQSTLALPLVLLLLISNLLQIKLPQYYTLIIILAQVVGWGTQFFAHAKFEGRRPALVDNAFQVFIAPLFVMLEFLFAIGWNKQLFDTVEKKLKERNARLQNKKL